MHFVGCIIKDFDSRTMRTHFIILSGSGGDRIRFVFCKKKKFVTEEGKPIKLAGQKELMVAWTRKRLIWKRVVDGF